MSTLCRGCGRSITGSYIVVAGSPWHEDCFKCAGCRRPIGKQPYYEKDGRPYHESCYQERFSPRCAACGQPIAGRYTTALGKNWHPEHFTCAHCKRPFAGSSYYERDGKVYCERDYWELFGKRCVIGGEILKGEYQSNSWGDTFCKDHAARTPECFSCHRPICQKATGGGVCYGDGRTLCNLCRRTAVDDAAAAQRMLDGVRKGLAGCGIVVPPGEISVRLVDQPELVRQNKHGGKPPSGMALSQAEQTHDGRELRRWVEGVLVLHGLPAEHFQSVAAHELMHCYLWLSHYPKLTRTEEEGLCELTEWLWLQQRRDPLAAHLAKGTESDDDPVYGAGFRAARAAYDRMGLPRLLAEVKKRGRLP